MSGKLLSLSLVVLLAKASSAQFKCPESKGHFPDPDQCDLYHSCSNGESVAKLCKDGLVFRDDNPKREDCDLPANVDCGDRKHLQEPKPSPGCPRQNGHFRVDAPASCDRYHNCIDGVPQLVLCSNGLIYDDEKSSCVWPFETEVRCDKAKHEALPDGFICPEEHEPGPNGVILPHPTYPHQDCDKFYICKNGAIAQVNKCDKDLVYNHDVSMCTDPESVPDCKDFFKDTKK